MSLSTDIRKLVVLPLQSILDELENTISDIRNSHPTARILGGDFDASGIDWQHKSLEESYVIGHEQM